MKVKRDGTWVFSSKDELRSFKLNVSLGIAVMLFLFNSNMGFFLALISLIFCFVFSYLIGTLFLSKKRVHIVTSETNNDEA